MASWGVREVQFTLRKAQLDRNSGIKANVAQAGLAWGSHLMEEMKSEETN